MQTGNTYQRKRFTNKRHPKAGVLINLCKSPIMSNTMAAVFFAYRLSLSKDFFLCDCCLPCSCNCLSLFLTLSLSGDFFGFFVNCSGLTCNHMRERTLVLSFLMFKVISIFVLKLSKFLNPKACRLISLTSLLMASSLALE